MEILRRISYAYNAYKLDIKQALSDGATKSKQNQMKSRYRSVISGLFSTYRGLPYHVANRKSGTKLDKTKKSRTWPGDTPEAAAAAGAAKRHQDARYSPRVSPYIPLVDWVTMHRMLTSAEFGPEWGGHQLWDEEDGDETANEKREAVEQFIINVHGLDKLAVLIGEGLDDSSTRRYERGTTYIDPADLLDPINRLFKKGLITPEECLKLFGYNIGEDTSYTAEDGLPWMNSTADGKTSGAVTKMFDNFKRWTSATNTFYPVGVRSEVDPLTKEPHAYIRVMNVVFPSNFKGDLDTMSPRERISRVRDPDEADILNVRDLYAYELFSGEPSGVQYYPIPKDPKELAKYLRKLKSVRHISVKRYAEAISEYLIQHMENELFVGFQKESIHRYGMIKYSKKLKKHMYSSSIIKNAELYALWKLLTN